MSGGHATHRKITFNFNLWDIVHYFWVRLKFPSSPTDEHEERTNEILWRYQGYLEPLESRNPCDNTNSVDEILDEVLLLYCTRLIFHRWFMYETSVWMHYDYTLVYWHFGSSLFSSLCFRFRSCYWPTPDFDFHCFVRVFLIGVQQITYRWKAPLKIYTNTNTNIWRQTVRIITVTYHISRQRSGKICISILLCGAWYRYL